MTFWDGFWKAAGEKGFECVAITAILVVGLLWFVISEALARKRGSGNPRG